ncbi:GIY-YIG nuclease family protein [Caballeronia sp. ATUFL_M1_KS5A]|uniref:GIY-YIG nuclease family protein n=1 Tax=Caballeronia sp. ATUFL_M1_KS5A TaxID=2921778 RepID=UPI0020290B16|nr:GIY-YIG nuclease family protein [Caballeronia sp. ATUFL_M1_KS5A]
MKQFKVGNEAYNSIAELALAHNLQPSLVSDRLRKGLTPEEAVRPVAEKREGTVIELGGETHASVHAFARAYDLPIATVAQRLQKGWTPAEAVGIESRSKQTTGHEIVVGGCRYPSRRQACKALGIEPGLVHSRLKAGRSIDEAFGLVEFDYGSKPKILRLEGRNFASLVEACRFYNVDKYVLNARINRYGWTIEEALGVAPRPGYEKGVAGLVYLVRNRINEKPYVGITMGTLEQRWKQHIDLAFSDKPLSKMGLHGDIKQFSPEMFTIEVIGKATSHGELAEMEIEYIKRHNSRAPRGYNLNGGGSGARTKGRTIAVRGEIFPSITAACNAFNADRRQVTSRLAWGWTTEEALELVEKIEKAGPRPVFVNGVQYPSWRQAAIALRTTPETLKKKSSKDGQLVVVGFRRRYELVFRGVTYESETALCKAFGVTMNAYNGRKQKGLSIEECLGLVAFAKKHEVAFRGITYASTSALCSAFGVKKATYDYRRRKGLSIEACLGLARG